MNISIARADSVDCSDIADLHVRCLDRGFLGTLGRGFMILLYESLLEWEGGILLVATKGKDIQGFVAGASDSREFFKYFLRKKMIKALILIFPRFYRKDVVVKIIEVLRHKKQDYRSNLPHAELISIAVNEDMRGTGISALLFETFVENLKCFRINRFKIIVGSELTGAIKFYLKMGCKKTGTVEVHKASSSEVMIF